MRYNVAQSRSMSEVYRGQDWGDKPNSHYNYTYNVYTPDNVVCVYDSSSDSYVYADRLTVDEALSFWEEWGPVLTRWEQDKARAERLLERSQKRYVEARDMLYKASEERADAVNAITNVVTFLGEQARKHSIDNSLCENYERFLNNVIRREINNPEDVYLRNNDTYKGALQQFYVYATRTRAAEMTVGVPASGYTTGGGRSTITWRSGNSYETTTENSTSVLSYEDAHKANSYAENNGWTRGHEAFAADVVSNERPSNPSDGDQHNGATYCSSCNEWHEDN